jgi:hypothetical protein
VAVNAIGLMLRRQTDLTIAACRRQARIALLRPRLAVRPGPNDFAMTAQLYRWGQAAASAFVAERLRGRRLRPGLFEYDTGRDRAAVVVAGTAAAEYG